jgi:hypothetical protein
MAIGIGAEVARGAFNRFRPGKKITAAAACVALGLGAGVWADFAGLDKKSMAFSTGKGVIEKVYPLLETNYGGMDVRVSKASARVDHKPLGVDVGIWASEEFNGVISVKIGTNDDPKKATKTVREDFTGSTPKITVTVPPEALQATVFEQDPTDPNLLKSDRGASWSLYDGFASLVQGLPGELRISGSDQARNLLGGIATEEAYLTASEGCAPKAWPFLEPILNDNMRKEEMLLHNQENPMMPVTLNDITVNLPAADQVHLPTQYQYWWDKNQKNLSANGFTFNLPDPQKLQCEPSSHIKVVNVDQ